MDNLLLRFTVRFEILGYPILDQHHGPLFHRWLPDGEKNAIVLDTGDENADLKVWFERLGFVDHGIIKYDAKRREVDPDIMAMQAVLDAGPLQGLLVIRNLPDEEVVPLRKKEVGNALYVALGKRIVKKLVYPPVATFIDILRINYGQHWLQEMESWDSRWESLGNYCHYKLFLRWSLDGGRNWDHFIPDEVTQVQEIRSGSKYGEYLTEDDWQELGRVVGEGYKPSLAASLLARSHQLSDIGDLRYAYVEGVSALELALNEFLRQKLHGGDKSLFDAVQSFWTIPSQAQIIIMATLLGGVSQDVEFTIKAIQTRNAIVHEGKKAPDDAKIELSALFNTIALLQSGPKFKFPSIFAPVEAKPAEIWERSTEAPGPITVTARLDLSSLQPITSRDERGEEDSEDT